MNIDKKNRPIKTIWYLVFGGLRRYGERLLKSKGIAFPDRVYGTLQTGNMNESYLLSLIGQIRADLVEIYSHPAIAIPGEPRNGPLGSGQLELDALLSHRVREELVKNGFELINYNKWPVETFNETSLRGLADD